MATTYPNSSFIGVDILQTFPSEIKPANVKFVLGNVISGLDFESNSFDYVFVRHMKFAIPTKDWPNVLNELLRVLKPNSWLEIVDNIDFFDGETGKMRERMNRGIYLFSSFIFIIYF